MLQTYIKNSLLVFIRPRNTEVLQQILQYKNIEKIDGFILPKFSLLNATKYLYILANSSHIVMPSIEGSEFYKVQKQEYDDAIELCDSKTQIFNQNGAMAESSTMLPFAKEVIKRAEVYGIKYPLDAIIE